MCLEATRRHVGGHSYIWLREHGEDELQRASVCSHEPLNMATHVQLRVHFTPHCLAHYITATAGREHSFLPLLTEKLDQDDPTDWKVRAADDLF